MLQWGQSQEVNLQIYSEAITSVSCEDASSTGYWSSPIMPRYVNVTRRPCIRLLHPTYTATTDYVFTLFMPGKKWNTVLLSK
ncbi:hypothetical protein GDO81_007556 [Engystomops pustulosus]|uniref:Leptin receptor n=1 Tax=Engystomops pustulosus TaxID=76066 RepID=A0AAV7C942_ENGPU|nr:hypothetical protein GDO81_007556 [Engystomops pustulosus]